ncbi:hypothetical protein AJ80_00528 [Polytolypa hystricis UAMH7299]|uniref:Uncharacterized protein n=1 Tax=Polytolypa hystricis (strain UAMH7299) TaxID=1447883 RepID=A0A2B7Z304_POLH7|nr:hypothetical protein AJ80_00528 [Polytolypa hystricis UAMH7299]
MKARGADIPPALRQDYGPETNETSDTKKFGFTGKTQRFPGGSPGVVPRTPEGYSAASWSRVRLDPKAKAAKPEAQTNAESDGKDSGKETGDGAKENKYPSNKTSTDFGQAFEKNIRNAFLQISRSSPGTTTSAAVRYGICCARHCGLNCGIWAILGMMSG